MLSIHSLTRIGGFCFCRRGFNRRLRRLKKRRCQQKNIMLTIHSLTRIGGFCFCRRGFNRRLRRLKK
ncbi:hypothetical protein, partial [Microcoleus sp. CAWBG52]|uniref:hypothetical protein n=1 Tax=Microcoleus sp. CAWBG52 TaxID=2841649 RepID=UPI0025DB534F